MSRIDQVSDEPTLVVRHDPRCPACDGTGWERVYAMHTSVKNNQTGAMWKEKRWITLEQYEEFMSDPENLKHWKQRMAYTAVRRCTA